MFKKKKEPTDGSAKNSRFKQKEPWKYVEPKDLTTPIEIDGQQWFFCTKCKCRATGKIGFYQLSHTDVTHDPDWKPEGNLTSIADPDPTPVPPLRPLTTETQVLDDDLIFTGVNCAPVLVSSAAVDERENHDRSIP